MNSLVPIRRGRDDYTWDVEMPSVILVDKSLSMKRPIPNETSETRLSLAKKGLFTFFTYLENVFPLEYVSMMTFSSTCEVLVPFTKDHNELKESLDEIIAVDRTDLSGALQSIIDIVVKEWGVFNPMQIILVSDGILGVNKTQTDNVLSLPFPCKLHVVLIENREEMSSTSLDKICKLIDTSVSDIIFPTGSQLTSHSVTDMFLQLAQTHFKPFHALLTCGHLQSKVALSPSPIMTQSFHDIATTPQHRFKNPYTIGEYPTEISVCGFLDVNILSAPAVYSKHFVIDTEMDGVKLESLVKCLIEGKEQSKESDNISEIEKPSFRVLLHGSLKCESKVAVVQLGTNWFGFLSSAGVASKKSNLILTVLFPEAKLPWLGPLRYLGPKPPNPDPRMTDSGNRGNKDQFPLSVSHTLSYQSPAHFFWAKEGGIQNDLLKVVRYSHKLPEKEASLIKELNKIRLVILTYSIPNLLDVVCQILSTEEASTSNPQARAILQRSLLFLSNNHNPHDRMTITGSK